jgi:glycosyltransferase involved in cell wall biosynthesis
MRQTHPLDAIVVIDDASAVPPIDIVRAFPSVTLLVAETNVGPYQLIQHVIEKTRFDAYLMQDADDWSLPCRLELLLREAERTGAEYVSCQAYRLISAEADVVPLLYPLDVNAALTLQPTRHALMHPGSLISRDLVLRAGGYATGLRFGGDTEFEHRATHVGRLVNIPQFAYVVRNRERSLTTSPETGLRSIARQKFREEEFTRARTNAEREARGEPPLLAPLATAPLTPLAHVLGPHLPGVDGQPWPGAGR